MAKRYFKFSDIPEGDFKCPGTLGTHYLSSAISRDGKNKSVRGYTTGGGFGGVINLRQGDTLGYDCGHIWRQPCEADFRDPIRACLFRYKLPKTIVTSFPEGWQGYSSLAAGYSQETRESYPSSAQFEGTEAYSCREGGWEVIHELNVDDRLVVELRYTPSGPASYHYDYRILRIFYSEKMPRDEAAQALHELLFTRPWDDDRAYAEERTLEKAGVFRS